MNRFVLALPLALLAAVWAWYLLLPWPVLLRWRDPGRTAVMSQRVEQAGSRGEPLELRHTWVPLDGISPQLRRAVIAAEDGRFREHNGIDWTAIGEEVDYRGDGDFSWLDPRDLGAVLGSIRYYLGHRGEVRGRSTITQQAAKNLYFSTSRSLVRKVEEMVVARRLERFLDKDRILEIYLNIAELGPGIFGVEAAAQHYFGRSAANVTPSQAAALAATLPHPLSSNPAHRPGRMQWRQQLILQRLGSDRPAPSVPLEPEPIGEPVIEEPADPVGEEEAPCEPADECEPAPATEGPPPQQPPPDAQPDAPSAPPDTATPPADTAGARTSFVSNLHSAPGPRGARPGDSEHASA